MIDTIEMSTKEFQSYVKSHRKAGYEEGWSECMKLWADHMKRMNDALAATKEVTWKADGQTAPTEQRNPYANADNGVYGPEYQGQAAPKET